MREALGKAPGRGGVCWPQTVVDLGRRGDVGCASVPSVCQHGGEEGGPTQQQQLEGGGLWAAGGGRGRGEDAEAGEGGGASVEEATSGAVRLEGCDSMVG